MSSSWYDGVDTILFYTCNRGTLNSVKTPRHTFYCYFNLRNS